jgi:predicted DCC family thiol-disulfide oxidoreductase YuxK
MAALRIGEDKPSITLYGEGYGAGIQKGGGEYRADKGFVLFDVLIDGRWWLASSGVTEIAERLCIPRVPVLGVWSLPEIIENVRAGMYSTIAENREHPSEGIVARPVQTLYDNRMKRIILKLKTRDFIKR